MKTIIQLFFFVLLPLQVFGQEHRLNQRFQSEQSCMESLEAVKFCAEQGKDVASCRKGEFVDWKYACSMSSETPGCENLGSDGMGYRAIITCGNAFSKGQFCKQVIDKLHFDVRYINTFCRTHTYTPEEYQRAHECLPSDAKARAPKHCAISCSTMPKVTVCDFSTKEWEIYGERCHTNMMVTMFRKSCPEGSSDVDPELGNPPRISVSGKPVVGKDGAKLLTTFTRDVELKVIGLRGPEASYCVFPRGQQCSSPVAITIKSHSLGFPLSVAPGSYTVEVKSGNGLKASKNFSVVQSNSHEKNFEYCRMRTGFACTKDRKEVELFYLCGEKPTGEGWMTSDEEGKYFRYTNQPCNKPGTNNYHYIDTTTSDSNENYQTTVTYGWQEYHDPWYRGKDTLESVNPPSAFKGQSCSANLAGNVEKDNRAGLWICAKEVGVVKVANEVKSKDDQCLYYDYKDVSGKKVDAYLEEGASTVRRIIKDGELISQKIKCEDGELIDAGELEQAKKCMYENYLSLDGRKTINYLDNNASIVRQIIANGKLQLQTIRCRNGELQDLQQLAPEVKNATPCTMFDYTSPDGKYDSKLLRPHEKFTRNIVVRENGQNVLKRQKVECVGGELREAK